MADDFDFDKLPAIGDQPADVGTDDKPAELSLEGRLTQLEEKVSQSSERTVQPEHTHPEGVNQPTGTELPTQMPYGGAVKAVNKSINGSKLYIGMISAVLIIFLAGFVYECVRVYKSNGIFGGDLERFIDTDYDFFGKGDSDEDDEDGFGGLFPFDFYDSDSDDILTPPMPDPNEELQSDSDYDVPDGIKEAPSADSVVNAAAAKLKAADQPSDIDSSGYTARSAYKRVENSVVGVVIYSDKSMIGQTAYKLGSGSGIVVSKDGYIITNSHVIEDSKTTGVEIILTNGAHYAAAIVGYDTRTDLAVLKIDADGLTSIEFVNSDQIDVGQDAFAVGNPGGLAYSNSFTRGCVSALNRTVQSNTLVSYIQTDAAINPGNSGGPLLNSAGQVMGITTIKIANTDYEGMGFAIPSNQVIEVANSLIENGYVAGRVKLGILGSVYTAGIADDIYGIEVQEIQEGSPLKGSKVKKGGVIVKVDGTDTPDFSTLFKLLGEHEPGDEVTLSIYRPPTPGDAGGEFDVKIKLVADNG